MDYRKFITIDTGKRGGKPCIRGLRITVGDVLGYLASGMSVAEVLDDFPDLTAEDIQACFAFAAAREQGCTAVDAALAEIAADRKAGRLKKFSGKL
jgi:uncharacterized protein (DUF433 family)